MVANRLRTFVGFAIKKRGIVIGVDNITSSRGRIKVVLIDGDLSAKSAEKVSRYATDRGIDCFTVNMASILPERTCKAIGITDSGLADAIKKELKES